LDRRRFGVVNFRRQIPLSGGTTIVLLTAVGPSCRRESLRAKKLGWDVTFLATPTNVLEVPTLGEEAVEGPYAAALFEIPYEDTAKGKVKTGRAYAPRDDLCHFCKICCITSPRMTGSRGGR
jgi:hypothetical protein